MSNFASINSSHNKKIINNNIPKPSTPTTNFVRNVLGKVMAYKPEAKCLMCLTEKYHIIFSKLDLLNSRNELVTKCCHENKFYLANFKDIIP